MSMLVRKATRDSYGESLVELGKEYKDIIVLDADLAKATKTIMFKEAFPNRFFDCGIAECNMLGVAAGLATTGKIVFASSFAMFTAGRGYEIIRNSICYPNLNVKIAASHAGISVGEDGATHQCCEDISLMRSIPNMTVLNPCDDIETKQLIKKSVEIKTPVYIRLGRLATPILNNQDYDFEIGKGVILSKGNDITIIATGLMVYESLIAENMLFKIGINARVINIHTIKPIDKEIIISAARETSCIVTVEEHSIIGGLGSAISEVVCENCPVPVIKIGINDVFGMSGTALELLKYYGLSNENIFEVVKESYYKYKKDLYFI